MVGEVGERRGDGGVEERYLIASDEVEEDGLWAGGVLQDGEDGGHGAAKVDDVEGHGDVDESVGRAGGGRWE